MEPEEAEAAGGAEGAFVAVEALASPGADWAHEKSPSGSKKASRLARKGRSRFGCLKIENRFKSYL